VTLRGNGKWRPQCRVPAGLSRSPSRALDGISALAADTDGIDGAGDNAGAVCDGTTAARMRAAGVDPRAALANNDAYTAFRAVNGLLHHRPHRHQCERLPGDLGKVAPLLSSRCSGRFQWITPSSRISA
jgi:glycerate 2-kinase